MGKKEKDKVYQENGKVAQGPMQNYWNKQRSKEMQKNKERAKQIMEEKTKKAKEFYAMQSKRQEETGDMYDRNKINGILAEKEKRRMGQYNSSVSLGTLGNEMEDENHNRRMINVPGHGLIDAREISQNKKVIQKTKDIHLLKEQKAKARKEREEQMMKGEDPEAAKNEKKMDKDKKVDFNVLTPAQVQQMMRPKPKRQEENKKQQNPFNERKKYEQQKKNDPFYKLTEDEDYNPQEKAQIKNNQIYLNQTLSVLNGGLQAASLPPPLVSKLQPDNPLEIAQNLENPQNNNQQEVQPQPPSQPPLIQQQIEPQLNPKLLEVIPEPPKPRIKIKEDPNVSKVTFHTADDGKIQTIIEKQSTVKRSQIDLTQKKQLFIPHHLMNKSVVQDKKVEPAIKDTQTEKEYQQFLKELNQD